MQRRTRTVRMPICKVSWSMMATRTLVTRQAWWAKSRKIVRKTRNNKPLKFTNQSSWAKTANASVAISKMSRIRMTRARSESISKGRMIRMWARMKAPSNGRKWRSRIWTLMVICLSLKSRGGWNMTSCWEWNVMWWDLGRTICTHATPI